MISVEKETMLLLLAFSTLLVGIAGVSVPDYSTYFMNLSCGEIKDRGFKNVLFHVIERKDLFLRLGLSSGSESVLKLDDFERVTKLLGPVALNQSHVAVKYVSCFCSAGSTLMKKEFHIATNGDVIDEVYDSARSAAIPGAVYGTSVPIFKATVPLHVSYHNQLLFLVIEFTRKVAGNIQHLMNVSELDIMKIIYGFVHGQLNFITHSSRLHTDGHSGNILFEHDHKGQLRLMWADFGKTSQRSNATNQFLNSLASMQRFVLNKGTNRTKPLADMLFNHYYGPYPLSENSLRNLLTEVQSFVINQTTPENSTDVLGVFMNSTVPSGEFAFTYLSSRIDDLRADVEAMKKREENVELMVSNLKSTLMKEAEEKYLEHTANMTAINNNFMKLYEEMKMENQKLRLMIEESTKRLGQPLENATESGIGMDGNVNNVN